MDVRFYIITMVLFGAMIGACFQIICKTYKSLRDPFQFSNKKNKKITKINLEGIVCTGQMQSVAVLSSGEKREVVVQGEHFLGYTLTELGKNFVVLVKGKQKQKLFIN